jgi:hypothetical protein
MIELLAIFDIRIILSSLRFSFIYSYLAKNVGMLKTFTSKRKKNEYENGKVSYRRIIAAKKGQFYVGKNFF